MVLMTPEVLATIIGAGAGVLIAHLESRRAPVDEHIRHQIEDLRERMVKLEQKYLAYPSAAEMLQTFARLESMFEDVGRRMDRVEGSGEGSTDG